MGTAPDAQLPAVFQSVLTQPVQIGPESPAPQAGGLTVNVTLAVAEQLPVVPVTEYGPATLTEMADVDCPDDQRKLSAPEAVNTVLLPCVMVRDGLAVILSEAMALAVTEIDSVRGQPFALSVAVKYNVLLLP